MRSWDRQQKVGATRCHNASTDSPSTDSRAEPRRLEQFCPRLLLRYCVQLCMTYIDHPRQIPEPYDLASFSRVENGIST